MTTLGYPPAMDRHLCSFVVLGEPKPKGSYRAVQGKHQKHAFVVNDNPGTKPWQVAVAWAARVNYHPQPPCRGPVRIEVCFYLPRPKSLHKKVKVPTKKRADLDKLERALLDGIKSGGVYVDDAQVVAIVSRKVFAGGVRDQGDDHEGVPRATVTVYEELDG